MPNFDKRYRLRHATLSADPVLFQAIAGVTPEEFCSQNPATLVRNDIVCWEIGGDLDDGIFQWVATIPCEDEIQSHGEDEHVVDHQPRYPWCHIGDIPFENEPYELCRRLLEEEDGSIAVIPPELLPYCAAIAEHGFFVHEPDVEVIGEQDFDCCSEVCRLIRQGEVTARIAVGFAFDGEGWTPHAWLVNENGEILDTEAEFDSYFGVVLTDDGTAAFIRHYYPDLGDLESDSSKPWKATRKRPLWQSTWARPRVAIDFDEDFRFTHATLSANPTLFEDLFGITPEEFCSLVPENEEWPEEICWASVYERGELLQWIASIPTPEEIASHIDDALNDPQPLYPWRHIDECPYAIEPYHLCERLLKESGNRVAVFADIAPYCGALTKYGAFLRNPEVEQIADCGNDHCPEVCRQYREELVDARIAIGFATDDCGTWFPHVWLVQSDGKVLELMDPFATYFGVVLSEGGSDAFAEHYSQRSRVGRRHPRWD